MFQKVWGFLSQVALQRDMQELKDLGNLVPKARFLFGNETADYMKLAEQKQTELAVTLQQIRANQGGGQVDVAPVMESTNLQQWFWNEASNCFQRFSSYLDFSHWKVEAA